MTRSVFTTPTPWIAAGMGLVLGLVCLLMGAGEGVTAWLQAGYQAQGFPPGQVLAEASPAGLMLLILSTLGVVVALEGTPGAGRRMMLLLSSLVILVMASPVLALWGVFWNPLVNLISILWAGIAAMVHAASRERTELLRNAEKQNVVPMRPPRSPRSRKMK